MDPKGIKRRAPVLSSKKPETIEDLIDGSAGDCVS